MERPIVTYTPHIHTTDSVNKTMRNVLIALAPAALLGVYFFGLPALLIILVSVVSAVVFEAGYQKLTGKEVTIKDGSAVITGLLLAMTLPPGTPLWLPVIGTFIGIVVVKQVFGGLGQNFLNPALVARSVLAISFAGHMDAGFLIPLSGFVTPDVITSPTPLALLNSTGTTPVPLDYLAALFGSISGTIGETSAILLLVGGLFLLITKTITWHIPVSFIGTAFVMTVLIHPSGMGNSHAAYQLLLGGLILGAFFMATDYPTSPMTSLGKVIFGIGCGVLTVVIRLHSGFPEGVAYAILIMNLTVPLIDRFIRPRVYGTKRSRAKGGSKPL
jgi:electron transport complex protein RnfD